MASGGYGQVAYGGGTYGGFAAPASGGGGGTVTEAAGYDLAGVLNYLAGITSGALAGGDLAASLAWPAINGHGSKAASVPTRSMLGALNAKNGSVGLGLNLVCNQLAGTTGLEAPLALRTYAGLK